MIYLFFLVLLLYLSYRYDYLGKTRNKERWFLFIGVFLVLLAGFRYRMGIDSIRYEIKYLFVPVLSKLTYDDLFDSDLKAEPLFMLLYSISKTISKEFWVMQMLQSMLVVGIFLRFIRKNTSYWFIASFLFSLILYLNFLCEIMRESCAVSMFLLGWEYFKDKSWIRYYICAIAAVFFHSAAFFLFVIPFIHILKIPRIVERGPLIVGLFVSFLLVVGVVIQANFSTYFQLVAFNENLIDKAELYSDGRLSGQILNIKGILSTIVNYMVYPIVALYAIKKKGICHPYINTMIFCALVVSILQIPVALMYRFNNYFLPFVIIALSEFVFSNVRALHNGIFYWKKDFSSCLIVLIPYIAIQSYSYRSPVGNTGHRLYEIYAPYTSIFDKSTYPERNEIYRYYGAE